MKKFLFIPVLICCSFLALPFSLWGASVTPDSVFARYMAQAQKFADDYPREKAYLHFDNTSYYVGDTIWFKAYVALAEGLAPSRISKPLYVELIDQAGHITDKQIVKLTDGVGSGQFVLRTSMFSGYYEIRAYTRWMLGFAEPQYFSRTFPIFKLTGENHDERTITNYTLSESMEQRPEASKDRLSLRFFPEGGQLVQGVRSRVAFKAESSRDGNVSVSGVLASKEGQELARIETLHDGMGRFEYTPSDRPAVVQVDYQGRTYKFKLPEALSSGYVMAVDNSGGQITVQVAANAQTPRDTLAVFVSHQGRPYLYQQLECVPGESRQFALAARSLPTGVLQFSLINQGGHTLCERFVYSYPRIPLKITPDRFRPVYAPYEAIEGELQLTDSKGDPVQGTLSVSVRDALRSDYLAYDNNLFTDLLFTSDLKGYIHQPGYYFSDMTLRKMEELDILMMVHGWRKYDMEQQIGTKPFVPSQLPEQQLVLYGQVKSSIMKKPLKDIDLSVVIKKKDAGLLTGQTVTDSEGRFSIPLEDFVGTEEALVQTRKQNKKRNKDTSIQFDRNFAPGLRPFDYDELHPQWVDTEQWEQTAERFDSLYMDSLAHVAGNYLLDGVVVESKRKRNFSTKTGEQSIDAYYDVRRTVDQLRDEGKFVNTIPDFLDMVNDQFFWDRRTNVYTYRQKPLVFIMDGKILSGIERQMMLTEIDGLSSIIICKGSEALGSDIIENSKTTSISEAGSTDMMASAEFTSVYQTDADTDAESEGTSTDDGKIGESILTDITKYIFVYLVPLPYHDVMNTNETAALGTRRTVLQGYTPVLEFYSPAYPDRELYMDKADKRRTLYWNPSLQTDEAGKALIKCYNNQYSTPLIIQAETMVDGKIGTVTYSTVPLQGGR